MSIKGIRCLALLIALLSICICALPAYAQDSGDAAVQSVIEQLEQIDTLEQMQSARSQYNVSTRYDVGMTNASIIAEHENARSQYESYVSKMFSARIAAQNAYDALSSEQKAQISSSLVAKLDNTLSTSFKSGTYSVSPRKDAYTFEAVDAGFGFAYEVSNHMVSGNIPQTFVLVDTSNGDTSWTPNGRYVFGQSNYEVTYCCDVLTGLEYSTDYKRVNLEDSHYYGPSAARHIRAILQNSYPYVTIDEMKASLRAGGLSASFVDSLTRADIIAAVQMAVWTYANAGDGASGGLGYFASIDIPRNTGIYFTALHDYTNECWEWFPGARMRSYDARAEYRVNTLAYYLCTLKGVDARNDQIVISDVQVTRADLIPGSDNTYEIGMYVYLNDGGNEDDDLTVTVTSCGADGSITSRTAQSVNGQTQLALSVTAHSGDTISVVVEGTQYLGRGVYFYEPEGGREVSQSLVGVGEGYTPVHAETSFEFTENIDEMGLRIYKTEYGTGLPLSDITFKVYSVSPAEGEILSTIPTEEEIARYQTAENLIGSLTTDHTGYAALELAEGTYLVVEEHNPDKIKAPVHPFYLMLPMSGTTTSEDGTITAQAVKIVSVYPKNETVEPPEETPVIPSTPSQVTGTFQIIKYDEADSSARLDGAQFQVYRAATPQDSQTTTIQCGGIQYAVVPVTRDGSALILTTDQNGTAVSPALSCGTYFLVETKAPNGYQLPNEAFSVTVASSEMTTTAVIKISNKRGHLLPETGGSGAVLFWLAGSLLTISAAFLLMVRKRRSA